MQDFFSSIDNFVQGRAWRIILILIDAAVLVGTDIGQELRAEHSFIALLILANIITFWRGALLIALIAVFMVVISLIFD